MNLLTQMTTDLPSVINHRDQLYIVQEGSKVAATFWFGGDKIV
jgi:hypothetical protein